MFDTFVAIGVVVLQLGIVALVVSWFTNGPVHRFVANNATIILRIIFIGAIAGSLTYEYAFGYSPCILCWYQRLAIFPIAFLAFFGDIRKHHFLQKQILLLAGFGLAIAVFHNIIDIFQISSLGTCGTTGPSCLARYVTEFGYITIPMMSLTILLAGLLIALLVRRYPQESVVAFDK